ncbi:MAG: class II fructose-bisphosphate aldolase [Candidatus Heimdallarchaeota archaeon]|nr:class II fructose-bisphosphate aldolase [Candidatus Heimdallarchaeota archaeon]
MIIADRKQAEKIIDRIKSEKVSMAIFCTASHWNTEAILMAAKSIGEKFGIEYVPVTVAMTYNYDHMPQAQMVTHTRDARLGFLSIMNHMKILAGDRESPYYNVQVLPHLDHANPIKDKWTLTAGSEYLASVMFDAQKYPLTENIEITREYVKEYKAKVMIEGIMDELNVFEGHTKQEGNINNYPERAFDYVKKTGVDFLVADLGTEQQSAGIGESIYLKQRAQEIKKLFNDKILVLHGTSCLSNEEIGTLPEDGILRVNMWTRIAREAGLHALNEIHNREEKIRNNDFLAIESNRYIMDSTEKAAEIMEEIMILLGYGNL